MPHTLVIVESPAKAKTIGAMLGAGYRVVASAGHLRDLPRSVAELPTALRTRPWARLGVDLDDGFRPVWVVPAGARRRVAELRAALRDADAVLLATDGDREGEAIAWHCVEVLRPTVPVRRMVVHEITEDAVRTALTRTRPVDAALVAAQEARRVLDRLVGWQLSGVLWRTVAPKLSAGRVQSVVVRLIVQRERERMRFVRGECHGVDAQFAAAAPADGDTAPVAAKLVTVDDVPVATPSDLDPTTGRLREDVHRHLLDAEGAERIASTLVGADARVVSARVMSWRRPAPHPFTTATLQQTAGRRFGWSSSRTMRVAQDLYEQGWITYPRTDATALADEFVRAVRGWLTAEFGAAAVPARPRRHRTRAAAAQEAHEAVRPAGAPLRPPATARRALRGDAARLYELVWARAAASQMVDTVGTESSTTVRVLADDGTVLDFGATVRRTDEPGWRRVYGARPDPVDDSVHDEGATLHCTGATATLQSSEPPPRWTEPALVAELERNGVGRPSTYASTFTTLRDRGYVAERASDEGRVLVPTWTAFAVTAVLEAAVPELVDAGFTASMEATLDAVARRDVEAAPWLHAFWFGDDDGYGLAPRTDGGPGGTSPLSALDVRAACTVHVGTTDDGTPVTVRVGRRGVTVHHGGASARLPDDVTPDESTPERLARFCLLPRTVGERDGVAVEALIGRNGPFLRHGDTTRDLPSENAVFTIGIDDALALLDAPRPARAAGRSGRAASGRKGSARSRAPVTLGEYGTDPSTGRTVVAKLGRFGPYVTDGKTNASIPGGRDPVSLRLDDAVALLRAKASGKRPPRRRTTTRRSAGTAD